MYRHRRMAISHARSPSTHLREEGCHGSAGDVTTGGVTTGGVTTRGVTTRGVTARYATVRCDAPRKGARRDFAGASGASSAARAPRGRSAHTCRARCGVWMDVTSVGASRWVTPHSCLTVTPCGYTVRLRRAVTPCGAVITPLRGVFGEGVEERRAREGVRISWRGGLGEESGQREMTGDCIRRAVRDASDGR